MRTMRLSRLWALASLSLWIPLSVPSVAIAAESGPLLPISPSPAEPTVLSRGRDGTPRLLVGALSPPSPGTDPLTVCRV